MKIYLLALQPPFLAQKYTFWSYDPRRDGGVFSKEIIRQMKKLIICIAVLILIFSLSSCISINKKLRIIGDTEDITFIDVYNIDVTDEYISLNTIDEYEPVYSVPTNELVAFANKMETIVYKKKYPIVPVPIDYNVVFASGYIVCIGFSDGEREIFSEQGAMTHNGYYPEKYNGSLSWAEEIESFIRQVSP